MNGPVLRCACLLVLLTGCVGCSEPASGDQVKALPTTGFEGELPVELIGGEIRGGPDERIGRALGCADLDGDGNDDLIVGTPYSGDAALEAGGAWVFAGPIRGSLGRDDASARISGSRAFAAAGWSVAGAGDVNGDGVEDLAIGAYADTLSGRVTGTVFVFEGPVQGDLSLDDATGRLLGESEFDKAGWAVAQAGDINGDGLGDLLIGAYTVDVDTMTDAGRTYIAMGPIVGTQALADAEVHIDGTGVDAYTGWSVAGVGDTDGDGFDDIAIGGSSPDGSTVGTVAWLFRGPMSRGRMTTADAQASIEVASGFARVAATGDVDGDGTDDLLVGAHEHGGGAAGTVWLVRGPSVGVIDATQALISWSGPSPGDAAGWRIDSAGDIDGDGLSDVIIGAPNADAGGPDSGAAFIVVDPLGRGRGSLSDTGRVAGQAPLDGLGTGLVGDCDFNGDGAADIAIGAPGAGTEAPWGPDGGAVYIYYGRPSGL